MNTPYRLYSSLPSAEEGRTWAEIDLSALRHNYQYLTNEARKADPEARPICVVKADAYGHGAPACIRTLLEEGCDFFAVSCLNEAIAAREVCREADKKAEILILGYTNPSLASLLAKNDLIQTLLSADYADQLEKEALRLGISVRVHAAADTGMNRIGFPAQDFRSVSDTVSRLTKLCRSRALRLEGVFSHLAAADEPMGSSGEQLTRLQCERFRALCSALVKPTKGALFYHLCNSAGTLRLPEDLFDGYRLGILLYGAPPSPDFSLPVRPVMRLKTRISHIHTLPVGESVGYGATFSASSPRKIATLPIGYADGLLRAFRGGTVTIETKNGMQKAPVVGRICMDQCMIDVTDTAAEPGDVVTLFGNDPAELAAYSERASTIDYECLCLISARVPRVYVDERK
ncbi:MAG: alanine racemase [Clostridia bacterium]|nr:alanine racemase [Clostridia bacterium]